MDSGIVIQECPMCAPNTEYSTSDELGERKSQAVFDVQRSRDDRLKVVVLKLARINQKAIRQNTPHGRFDGAGKQKVLFGVDQATDNAIG